MSDATDAPHAMQFDTAEQQHEAAALGMWAFLATEVLFFGGVLCGFIVYRMRYSEAFSEAGHELYPWIATANTAILLFSSFFMALAVHEIQHGGRQAKKIALYLTLTSLMGLGFLGVKAVEYYLDYKGGTIPRFAFDASHFKHPQQAEMFFFFYFFLTILHAFHMTIGIVIMLLLAIRVKRAKNVADFGTTVEMVGLYWHFVDVVWIFLFPLLYLVA